MKKIIILGIGNILFKDEGVGVYASRYLKKNYLFSSNIEIVDGGTFGLELLRFCQEYDKVIILDTISIKDKAGVIYSLPSDELVGLGSCRGTAHEVEVVQVLEICSMLDFESEVLVIGIVPKDIQSVEIGLSDEVRLNFPLFIDEVVKEVKKTGLKAVLCENVLPLNSIIETLICAK
jgi:hydrogenase maturation protease